MKAWLFSFFDRNFSKRGFTVLELLIFSGIFTLISVVFLTILVSVSRIQVRQSAASEVSQQSQFILQTVQRYVEDSSLIEMETDQTTSTLKLRMRDAAKDPTFIFLSGTTLYLRETATGTLQALSSDKVLVSNVSFVRRQNTNGKDTASVSFTVANNTNVSQYQFAQTLRTSIARVNAATFDSDIRASSTNTYRIGTAAQEWQSINNTLFFSGSNVGVGVASPGQTLEVNGGVRLNTATARPSCAANQRGTLWVAQNSSGTADNLEVCVRSSTSTYFWYRIY